MFSHLISDTSLQELHSFAAAADIAARAFDRDHYDVPEQRYADLVDRGAQEVDGRTFVRILATSGLRVPARQRSSALARPLLTRWNILLPGTAALGDELVTRWGERRRRYHDRTHLLEVIDAVELLLSRSNDAESNDAGEFRQVVLLAAWFHDAVHTGTAGEDEEASARLAEERLTEVGLRRHEVAEVARLVRLTETHAPEPGDTAGALLCDGDLAVLGRPAPDYRRYLQAVRAEYQHVPEDSFAAGRAAVVRRLLAAGQGSLVFDAGGQGSVGSGGPGESAAGAAPVTAGRFDCRRRVYIVSGMNPENLHTRARAFWITAPGRGELREARLPAPGTGEAMVRTLHSGISRGSETLVYNGQVPASVRQQMRAPFQAGDLPEPVKYGYLSVGVVEAGPSEMLGRTVFCLYPHQDRYVVPAAALVPVPDGIPGRRAVLAGTVETAVNALWEAGPRLGDRVAVIGAGMVGLSVAALLKRFPLQRLQLVDIDESKRSTAEEMGLDFTVPSAAEGDCDVVFHCSASGAGLGTGLDLLGEEGELIEMSWYGERDVQVPLGASFHARRLSIRASQVGAVAAARRARRSTQDRLRLALDVLADPVFDQLLTGSSDFEQLPETMSRLADGTDAALCHVIDYPDAPD